MSVIYNKLKGKHKSPYAKKAICSNSLYLSLLWLNDTLRLYNNF